MFAINILRSLLGECFLALQLVLPSFLSSSDVEVKALRNVFLNIPSLFGGQPQKTIVSCPLLCPPPSSLSTWKRCVIKALICLVTGLSRGKIDLLFLASLSFTIFIGNARTLLLSLGSRTSTRNLLGPMVLVCLYLLFEISAR